MSKKRVPRLSGFAALAIVVGVGLVSVAPVPVGGTRVAAADTPCTEYHVPVAPAPGAPPT